MLCGCFVTAGYCATVHFTKSYVSLLCFTREHECEPCEGELVFYYTQPVYKVMLLSLSCTLCIFTFFTVFLFFLFLFPLILFHVIGLVLWRRDGTEKNTLMLLLLLLRNTHTHTHTHTQRHRVSYATVTVTMAGENAQGVGKRQQCHFILGRVS